MRTQADDLKSDIKKLEKQLYFCEDSQLSYLLNQEIMNLKSILTNIM